ncbi:MAG: FAD-dependent thymidylate synthase [Phycisphaerales bacterium JB052]
METPKPPSDPIRFLDHGFVRYITHMNTDEDIVRCAKQSYDALDQPLEEKDARRLINYLMEHSHTSPFEMCELMVEIQAPLFVVQQLLRHRTASLNQLSMRYTNAPEETYLPPRARFAPNATDNKQSTAETPLGASEAAAAQAAVKLAYDAAETSYTYMRAQGVSDEVARVVIPHGQYTRLVWKCDLHNVLRFLALRTHPHAQQEIRELAFCIEALVAELWPMTYAAWREFRKHSVTFSKTEMELLHMFLGAIEELSGADLVAIAHELGMPKDILGSKRRGKKFLDKLGIDMDTKPDED